MKKKALMSDENLQVQVSLKVERSTATITLLTPKGAQNNAVQVFLTKLARKIEQSDGQFFEIPNDEVPSVAVNPMIKALEAAGWSCDLVNWSLQNGGPRWSIKAKEQKKVPKRGTKR